MANLLPGPGAVTYAPPPRPKPQPNPLAGILTDPNVVLAGMNRNQATMGANDLLTKTRSQALVNFGSPDYVNQLLGQGVPLDPNTAAAAGANQFSTLANLSHQNQIQGQRILNNLAGRGLAHSGELGYQQGEQARGYGNATYNAAQQLLSGLNQQLGTYLGTNQTADNNYLNALLKAFGDLGQNPLGVPGG